MAKIKGFQALHYNTDKCPQLSDVVAPPYDIITPERRARYYAQSEYNITRIISGEANADDTAQNNCHTRAADALQAWIEAQVLQTDAQDCIYIYEQEFEINHHHYVHRGLVSLLELTDFDEKFVLPHEATTPAMIDERFDLLSQTDTYCSQVYCLYRDDEKTIHAYIKEICRGKPDVEFTHKNGRIQRLWRISNAGTIAALQAEFADKQLVMADGHHRYIAGLRYRDAKRKAKPAWQPDDGFNYILTILVAVDNPGIVLFPPHRMIKALPQSEATLISYMKDDFLIEKIIVDKSSKALTDAISYDLASTNDSIIFSVYFGDNYYYRIRPRDISELDTLLPDSSAAYKSSDVIVLQKLILEKLFKIKTEDLENPDVISYTRIITEALEAVQSGEQQCCVIMKPTNVRELLGVAHAGEVLPPHSTYFYPKPVSGLLMYKAD